MNNTTKIMGILNVTPDSFSDGGKFFDIEKAIKHAEQMIEDGADIIDIGGESSRPGADIVSEEEELQRIMPVVKEFCKEKKVQLSIDTIKPEVAEMCLKLGADIINDVSGLRQEKMSGVVAKYGATLVITHMQGTPQTMQKNPHYNHLLMEITVFLLEKINFAKMAGVKNIIIDPGIGLGKKMSHNLQILQNLKEFKDLGYPILIGTSRKYFLEKIAGKSGILEGTIASIVVAVMNGANIIRVHDVSACKKAVLVADAIKNAHE